MINESENRCNLQKDLLQEGNRLLMKSLNLGLPEILLLEQALNVTMEVACFLRKFHQAECMNEKKKQSLLVIHRNLNKSHMLLKKELTKENNRHHLLID